MRRGGDVLQNCRGFNSDTQILGWLSVVSFIFILLTFSSSCPSILKLVWYWVGFPDSHSNMSYLQWFYVSMFNWWYILWGKIPQGIFHSHRTPCILLFLTLFVFLFFFPQCISIFTREKVIKIPFSFLISPPYNIVWIKDFSLFLSITLFPVFCFVFSEKKAGKVKFYKDNLMKKKAISYNTVFFAAQKAICQCFRKYQNKQEKGKVFENLSSISFIKIETEGIFSVLICCL